MLTDAEKKELAFLEFLVSKCLPGAGTAEHFLSRILEEQLSDRDHRIPGLICQALCDVHDEAHEAGQLDEYLAIEAGQLDEYLAIEAAFFA